MNEDLERRLSGILREHVSAPGHQAGFYSRLWQRIDAEIDGGPSKSVAAPPKRLRCWMRRVLAVAAALAAVSAVVVLFVGMPGHDGIQPAEAEAAQQALATIDAGLDSLTSLRGTLVRTVGGHRESSSRFWTTSAGDRRVETSVSVDWAQARASWSKERTRLAEEGEKRGWSDGRQAVTTCEVYSARNHQWAAKAWFVDVESRRPWGTLYHLTENACDPLVAWLSGWAFDPPLPGSASWNDRLSRYLCDSYEVRAALASGDSRVRVTRGTRRGRAAYEIRTEGERWSFESAWVDVRTGVVVELRSGENGAGQSLAWHLVSYAANRSLSRELFTTSPNYSLEPDGERLRASSEPRLADYSSDAKTQSVARATLPSVLGWDPALPSLAPSGFSFVTAVVPTRRGTVAYDWDGDASGTGTSRGTILVYRSGLRVVVVSVAKHPASATPSTEQLQSEDRGDYSYATVRHGFFAGFPIVLQSTRTQSASALRALGRGQALTVNGDLSTAEALTIVESASSSAEGGDYAPPLRRVAKMLFELAIAALAGVACICVWRRRRHAPVVDVGRGLSGWCVVAGVALVVLGVCLPWYAWVADGHVGWALRGWADSRGVAATACALAVLTAGLLRTLPLGKKSGVLVRGAEGVFGALVCVAVLLALWFASPLATVDGRSASYGVGLLFAFVGGGLLIAAAALPYSSAADSAD